MVNNFIFRISRCEIIKCPADAPKRAHLFNHMSHQGTYACYYCWGNADTWWPNGKPPPPDPNKPKEKRPKSVRGKDFYTGIWDTETLDKPLKTVEEIKKVLDLNSNKLSENRGHFGLSPMYRLKYSNLKVTDTVCDYMHAAILGKFCFP